MPTCPKCGSSRFSQYSDTRYMICGEGHLFALIELPDKIHSDKEKAYTDMLINFLTKLVSVFHHFREVR